MHGNQPALEVMLADLGEAGVDLLVFGDDVASSPGRKPLRRRQPRSSEWLAEPNPIQRETRRRRNQRISLDIKVDQCNNQGVSRCRT
jgi:hypothetical protein